MKTLAVWMIATVGYLQINSAAGGFCCPSQWTRYSYSCYWVGYGVKLSFSEAVKYCTARGAYLVRLESPAENTFLKDLLRKTKAYHTWTSLNDREHEGIWRWYGTNEHAVFSDWTTYEPNNAKGSEHCVAFDAYRQYEWNDDSCTYRRLPLCEK